MPHEAGPELRHTKIAPQALFALEDALALIYWYKPDLERFVRQTVDAPEVLARVSFAGTKRETARQLVGR